MLIQRQARGLGVFALLACAATAGCSAPGDAEAAARGEQAFGAAPRFLTARGAGTEASANAYYAANIVGFTPGTYTLSQWLNEFVPQSADLALGFYQNTNDLGFWREMYCTKAISRGAGGCFVVNWRNEDDRPAGRANAGTVAMNISPEGFTRFYAFGSNGVLTPSVRLDSEDPKFVPKVCVVCHAGATPVPATGDLGSVFREFETSLLKAPTGVSAGQMEESWLGLNSAVRTANHNVRSEAEGAPFGTDFAKARTVGHITGEIYGGASPTTSVPLGSQAPPASWDQAADPAPLRTAKIAVWRSVVAPSCMPCHRAIQDFDWADYLAFARVAKRSSGATSILDKALAPDAVRPMPQAELTSRNFSASPAARAALDAWINLVSPPSVPLP